MHEKNGIRESKPKQSWRQGEFAPELPVGRAYAVESVAVGKVLIAKWHVHGYPQWDTIFEFDYFISLVKSVGCFHFSLLSMRVLLASAASWFRSVVVLSLYFSAYMPIPRKLANFVLLLENALCTNENTVEFYSVEFKRELPFYRW